MSELRGSLVSKTLDRSLSREDLSAGAFELLSRWAMEFRFSVLGLRDGIPLTGEEIESLLLQRIQETGGTSAREIWDLAVLYSRMGRQAEAAACIEKLLVLSPGPESRAHCHLAMGQLQEQLGEFGAAEGYYRSALELRPAATDIWYWIHNNLGYSLLQLDRAREAVPYLEAAVAIDGTRPNAYKNLGLAHGRLGNHAVAAEHFVSATQANAADPRSLKHLDDLIQAHPELLAVVPELGAKLAACRRAVEHARSQQPDFAAHWRRLRGDGNRPA